MERGLSVRIIAFTCFSALCYLGASAIITVVLAILTAYLLDPFVNLLLRIRFPRGLAIFLTMLIAGAILAGTITLFVDRAQKFSENLPRYTTKIQKVSRDIRNRLRTVEKTSQDISNTIIPKGTKEPALMRIEQYKTWQEFFFRDLGPVYELLILISFFPFLVYFLLAEKEQIREFVVSLIRSRTNLSHTYVRDTSDQIVHDINVKVRGFVLGYLLSTAIIFFASWILFLLFRVEQAFLWAVIFALMNILPFVGAFLSAIPPIAIAILQFTSVQKAILLIVICLQLHLLYSNWLVPRTTGPRTELSPLMVLLAMIYWGFLWGAIGIFLAVPLTASLRSMWMQYRKLQTANSV